MSETVIRAEALGKRYRIGARERYQALRDVLMRAFTSPFRRSRGSRPDDYLWALRNVSFEIRQGDVVGLIGRNGAGKTTLLKILSRITRPTEGCAEIRGHVRSLLEVGTGFHPELTGRENVYLSGAVLGMKRAEIDRKFDEIVGFAGVERFLDTALKHFSTGMQMRLAFAVAAHLEPEILLVDEVLAVGDVEFQKKCLGKMQEVSQSGRTIVFVSHQMSQIRRLCERALWIDHGTIQADGKTVDIINTYETAMRSAGTPGSEGQPKDLIRWGIVTQKDNQTRGNVLTTLGSAEFQFCWELHSPVQKGAIGIVLRNFDGQIAWATVQSGLDLCVGPQSCSIAVPFFPLLPGSYYWSFLLYDGHKWIDYGQCFPEMRVETPVLSHPHDEFKGFLNVPYDFRLGAPR